MGLLLSPSVLWAIGHLALSNLFMTVAWYGHLKFKGSSLWIVILISWGIAFFEYRLQVLANRMGYGALSAVQLKNTQEVIIFWFLLAFLCGTSKSSFVGTC
jgi:uncharacterized protein (DUF486 family)